MNTQIIVPPMGESVAEATVAKWLKQVGDSVKLDEPLVELETDKVTLEVNAAAAGVISAIKAPTGSNVAVGAILGEINAISSGAGTSLPSAPAKAPPPSAAPANTSAAPAMVMPAAQKLAQERGVNPYAIAGSGLGGRVLKEDVLAAAAKPTTPALAAVPAAAPAAVAAAVAKAPSAPSGPRARGDREERVRMTRLRQRIAERLKEAQNTAAMLTTFNEIDMTNVIALRNLHKDNFEKKHGVKLGFMSFFVKACTHALKEVPEVNAEIDGGDVVYKNYVHMGVAVGTPSGLVVPVVRDADQMGFAAIEKKIAELGLRARDGKLSMAEMQGGSFTISNGGVYGSLMSSPILNPPQSGILGMHKIQDRPVVVGGQIVIRPMMYLALSYDHRIVDGKGAVTFLVRVKEALEDPRRLLMDL